MHPETLDSLSSSSPFASTPSSPGRSVSATTTSAANLAYFSSAPASPVHFLLSSSPANSTYSSIGTATTDPEQADFDFGLAARSMSTAEELFVNGQIRPGFHSTGQASHSASFQRRTRSVSPTRTPRLLRRDQSKESASFNPKSESEAKSNTVSETKSDHDFEPVSASTSRSSSSNSSSSESSNRNSKRWVFIKDLLLQRSKSEGRSLAAAGAGSRLVQSQRNNSANGYSRRGRGRSMHSSSFSQAAETANAKDMRRRTTFLPYKQGFLFGCLGFGSRGYGGAARGFATM